MRSVLHSGILTQSAVSPGVAALKGKVEKDAQHHELVEVAGGTFSHLLWTSLATGHLQV